jgi:hypothetical protein
MMGMNVRLTAAACLVAGLIGAVVIAPVASAQTQTPQPTVRITDTPKPPTTTAIPTDTPTKPPTPDEQPPGTGATPSPTGTPSPTLSPSPSPSATPSLSPTPSVTLTPSQTPLPSPTSLPVFPLAPGSVEGNINDAFPRVRYRFDAQAGDSVTLRMESTSGDLDPYLYLFGPGGTIIGRNDDDIPGSRNARIALTLPQTGAYTVEATRFTPDSATATASAGTFRLTLTLSGSTTEQTPVDPLAAGPQFAVPFTLLASQNRATGQISAERPQVYYAIGARQGDLIRAIMSATSGSLQPRLRLLGSDSEPLGREAQSASGEIIGFVTAPETGWYLIEVSGEGTGAFDLFVNQIAATALEVGQQVTGSLDPAAPLASYLVNGRFGDDLSVSLFTTSTGGTLQPRLTLRDVSGRALFQSTGDRFVTLRGTLPRSGPYLLEVDNTSAGASGTFNLRLSSLPLDIATLNAVSASYNKDYEGTISSETPLQVYQFSGKTGDLVTISMVAVDGSLDPALILMDSDLNELAANDNASIRRDARISLFRLPKDGDYLILAGRSSAGSAATIGPYTLTLSAGDISLEGGPVTVTLRWESRADLNLFVRDPSGQTISYSRPEGDHGFLQIDSNTACQTPGSSPVEHIYFTGESPLPGDYRIWVWDQDGCGVSDSSRFTLEVTVAGETIISTTGGLSPGERYETAIRVSDTGESGISEPGVVTQPSPQQRASEGGDRFISFGEPASGTISSEQYALFYQFEAEAGDVIQIRMERVTGDLDPMLFVRDADDRDLPGASNDDADAASRDAALTFTVPQTGIYIIAATRYGVRDGTTVGDFRLLVDRASAAASG